MTKSFRENIESYIDKVDSSISHTAKALSTVELEMKRITESLKIEYNQHHKDIVAKHKDFDGKLLTFNSKF